MEGVPHPQDFIKEALGNLGPEHVRAIMYENGRRMMPRAA
jgi:hypothetical protein